MVDPPSAPPPDSSWANATAPSGSSSAQELADIRLLGGLELRDASGTTVALPTRKAEALLALLAIVPGEGLSRDKICGLLWPEVPDRQARHSLRQTLLCLRKALPETAPPLLHAASRRLALDATRIRVDIVRVRRNLETGSRDSLEEAVALCNGELLEGLCLNESPFEQWLTLERQRFRTSMIGGLERLIELQMSAECYDSAIRSCLQLLRFDPLREATHRTLMRLYARQGRRAVALGHYRTLVRDLKSELNLDPEGQTRELYLELSRQSDGGVERRPNRSSSNGGVTSLPPRRFSSLKTTIGRGRELSALRAWIGTKSVARENVLCLLEGEAGVGKTHLCERIIAEAEDLGVRVLLGRCFESEQVLPFSLWVSLLSDERLLGDPNLLHTLPESATRELARLLPQIEAPPIAEGAVKRDVMRLFQAIHLLVSRFAARSPLLLVLEDLQWADEMSLRLLCFLSRQSAEGPRFILATAREEEVSKTPFLDASIAELDREKLVQRLHLSPLSGSETSALAEIVAGDEGLGPIGNARAHQVWSISEGNPLVIVETIRALARGEIEQSVERLGVPDRVRELILRRVVRTSSAAREILALAAVVGREFQFDLLRDGVTNESELMRAIEELVETHLLRVSGDHVYFTHDRIREAVYERLLPIRRRNLHAKVASVLERRHVDCIDRVVGPLGYHHSRAGNAAASIPCLIRFSEQAWRKHGVGEALTALEQALADAEQVAIDEQKEVILDIVTRQALCLAFLGRFSDMVSRLKSHHSRLESAGDPAAAAAFHFWMGFGLNFLGDRRGAEQEARQTLEQAQLGGDCKMTAYALALLSYLCAVMGRFEEGMSHGHRSTAMFDDIDDIPEASCIAWANLAANYVGCGRWKDALAVAETIDRIAKSAESARGQSLAAVCRAFTRVTTQEWEVAIEESRRAMQLDQDPFMLLQALGILGWALGASGQTAEAIAMLEYVSKQLQDHDMVAWSGVVNSQLANAYLAMGNVEHAERFAQRALDIARATDDVGVLTQSSSALAACARTQGRYAEARALLEESLTLCETIDAPIAAANMRVALAVLARCQRRTEEAKEHLRQARSTFASLELSRATEDVNALASTL